MSRFSKANFSDGFDINILVRGHYNQAVQFGIFKKTTVKEEWCAIFRGRVIPAAGFPWIRNW